MSMQDVLNQMLRDLRPEVVDGRLVSVRVPEDADPPAADADLSSIVVAGLVDLVIEAAAAPDARRELTGRALSAVEAIIPPARYAFFEQATGIEHHERAARMRGFEIRLTRSWLVPRLEGDIAAYRARIDALRRVVEQT